MLVAAVMVSVTGMPTASPPLGVIITMPVYVLGANAEELTMTVKGFNGVVPELTLVESQLPPLLVVDVTVNEIPAAPAALLTLRALFAGLEPCGAVKVSEAGNTVMFPVLVPLLTVRVRSEEHTYELQSLR